MTNPVQFFDARKEFHAALLESTLITNEKGIVSNADSSNKPSIAIAKGIAELLKAETIGERLAGQTAGNQFESICADYVKNTFLKLGHLRPAHGMYIRYQAGTGWQSPNISNMRI
nr:NgoMIV family type II restriction endonuclease [Paludibacterium denitrificans]